MPFLSGMLLGLSLILPIGAQNVFVLNQGLLGGLRKGVLAAIVAGVCDTTLILVGAAGLSAVLAGTPLLRTVLLWLGVALLLYLSIASFRASGHPSVTGETTPTNDDANGAARLGAHGSTRGVILTGIGVSWGNPHAILDTVAILGAAIAAQQSVARTAFAAGTVTASWIFFFVLALMGALLGKRVTPSTEVWINRISGVIMLVFALILAHEAFVG